jgi:hypothetical protein
VAAAAGGRRAGVGVEIPETLSVGDEVRFTLRGSPPIVVLTAIEKVP